MMKLFHTSFSIVENPSITEGRANVDFARGFYLSDDEEFSKRWARRRKGMTHGECLLVESLTRVTVLNVLRLEMYINRL